MRIRRERRRLHHFPSETETARTLSADPFVVSDYVIKDETGRDIDHLLIEQWVVAYWVDHAVREVRIVEIEVA